ncbi:MAG: DUF3006 domain-containing protein [Butyricicoccus pullicaecorum]|nr:DUF3006 domain-containing protein [Butyricicoccus pullicaecorum]
MKQKAIVDRFEGDFVVLERDDGTCINIPRANAPAMVGEGMVVWYDGDHILSIDEAETARREYDMQVRFERLLGRHDRM